MLATRNLVAALRELEPEQRPRVLVSQSASGWYGPHGDEPVDESEPAADDIGAASPGAARPRPSAAEELGVRVVRTRGGGRPGRGRRGTGEDAAVLQARCRRAHHRGRQYMPWIRLDDVVGGMLFCLDTEAASGPVDLRRGRARHQPGAVGESIGRVLKLPAFAPVPGFAVKVLYGDMARIIWPAGVRAMPVKLRELG